MYADQRSVASAGSVAVISPGNGICVGRRGGGLRLVDAEEQLVADDRVLEAAERDGVTYGTHYPGTVMAGDEMTYGTRYTGMTGLSRFDPSGASAWDEQPTKRERLRYLATRWWFWLLCVVGLAAVVLVIVLPIVLTKKPPPQVVPRGDPQVLNPSKLQDFHHDLGGLRYLAPDLTRPQLPSIGFSTMSENDKYRGDASPLSRALYNTADYPESSSYELEACTAKDFKDRRCATGYGPRLRATQRYQREQLAALQAANEAGEFGWYLICEETLEGPSLNPVASGNGVNAVLAEVALPVGEATPSRGIFQGIVRGVKLVAKVIRTGMKIERAIRRSKGRGSNGGSGGSGDDKHDELLSRLDHIDDALDVMDDKLNQLLPTKSGKMRESVCTSTSAENWPHTRVWYPVQMDERYNITKGYDSVSIGCRDVALWDDNGKHKDGDYAKGSDGRTAPFTCQIHAQCRCPSGATHAVYGANILTLSFKSWHSCIISGTYLAELSLPFATNEKAMQYDRAVLPIFVMGIGTQQDDVLGQVYCEQNMESAYFTEAEKEADSS